MTSEASYADYFWRSLAIFAWAHFFLMGLLPIWTFQAFRNMGAVLTQDAIVNSPHIITIAWSLFIGYFAYHRCREAGDDAALARGKAAQLSIIALPAFMCGPLEDVVLYYYGLLESLGTLTASVAAFKFAVWSYLYFKILRYYLGAGSRVFTAVPSLFPSTYPPKEEPSLAGSAVQAEAQKALDEEQLVDVPKAE